MATTLGSIDQRRHNRARTSASPLQSVPHTWPAAQPCGTRRVQAELRAKGLEAGRDRIARLRRQMGLHCRQKRRFKTTTTDSNHALPVAENLWHQRFEAAAPDQV